MNDITLAIEIATKILSPIFTTGEGLLIMLVFALGAIAMTYKKQHNC
jgi:hypothetical protein